MEAAYSSEEQAAAAQLLERLLVGARKMLETPDAWATRLLAEPVSPLAERFVDALCDEWLPADPPDALGQAIAWEVRHHLGLWHPGWPHLWAHTLRVTGTALALAAEADIEPSVVYVMGLLHDVGKLDELRDNEAHEVLGADFAERVLAGRLPAETIAAIQAAILKEGDGPLADILHDADKLDKIGACGVMRRVSVETRPSWLVSALWRVEDDLARFPAMHFPRSEALAARKQVFLRDFLPLAKAATGGAW